MLLLFKKALRAIWRNKKAYISCVILIMIGLLMYISMGTVGTSLQTAKLEFYEETNFADAFSSVRGISRPQVDSLRIDGITDVSARVVVDSKVHIEDIETAITLRLLSRNKDPLNQFVLYGNDIVDDFDILMSENFLKAWDLEVYDTIDLIINNQLVTFTIRGTFSSPEYIYVVDPSGSIMPDESTFNIASISENVLLSLNNNLYNDLSFAFAPGIEFSDIEVALEDALQRFGLISLVAQEDQYSNAMVTMEIDYISAIGSTIPMLFIIISILLLYLMLKRMIEQERAQVGTLKAFGYTGKQILMSYAFYGVLTGLIGGILGIALGYLVSGGFLIVFAEFFNFPNFVRTGTLQFSINGLLIAIIGGGLGSIMGAKSTLKLQPAESMRPVVPNVKHKVHHGFWEKWLPTTSQMSIRSISRNRVRSIFIVFGLMFAFGMLTFMASYSTIIDDVLLATYNKIQLYDGKVTFHSPVRNAVTEIERIQGITYAEAIVELPAEVSFSNRSVFTILTGLPSDSTLLKIYDTDRNQSFPPPTDGIILISEVAQNLGVAIGDYVTINETQIKIVEVVQQGMGSGAYLEKKHLSDIMNFEGGSTSVLFNAYNMSEIKRIAREGTNIRSLDDQAHTRTLMQDMLGPLATFSHFFLIIGLTIAFAICYNTASIALMERKREYATLRVLGMHMKEVANILGFEYWVLALCGMILGFRLPSLLLATINNMLDIDTFSLSSVVPMRSYIIGITCMFLAIYISNSSNVKNVRKMEMVEVLKERE
jgi:putative ABC transport system permease protein